MAKYKNARIAAEMAEDDFNEEQDQILSEEVHTEEDEQWKKRYGDLRRYQQEQEARLKGEVEELRKTVDTLSRQQINSLAPPKTVEELEAWMKTYPDFAGINRMMIQREVEDILKKEGISELKNTQKQIQAEKAMLALKKLHPNCEEIFNDQKFHDWLLQQPKKHQNFIYQSFNVDDAALVLNNYELFLERNSNRKSEDDQSSRRSAARAVDTRSKPVQPVGDSGDYWYTESQIQRGDSRWWDANEERIMEAQRLGKILLDLTGGAH